MNYALEAAVVSIPEDSTTPSAPAAAGWYPDADLRGTERYYDGTAWTENTRPVEDDVVAKMSSKKGWIIGGAIAAGAVLVGVIAGVSVSASSGSAVKATSSPEASAVDLNLVAVPDLIGMTVADARSEMNKVGLALYVPDGTDDQAIIATQTFQAGREVADGTEVLVTVESTPEPAADSLSFADGAALNPLAMVGWQLSLGSDDGNWTLKPDAEPGEVIFVNADGTCTAQYWQQTYETAAADDLAASDEFLGQLSGATSEEIVRYAFDGHFARSNGPDGPETDGEVATRTLLWDNDEGTFLLTARVFRTLDYATSTMNNAYSLQIQCAAGVDPETVEDSLDAVAKVTVSH
jgi:hypothetical protein